VIHFQKPIIPQDLYRGVRDSQLIGLSGYSREVLIKHNIFTVHLPLFFWLSSLVARLAHLNVEKCGIQGLNPGHFNNVPGSYLPFELHLLDTVHLTLLASKVFVLSKSSNYDISKVVKFVIIILTILHESTVFTTLTDSNHM
jgi:hypothetical protein